MRGIFNDGEFVWFSWTCVSWSGDCHQNYVWVRNQDHIFLVAGTYDLTDILYYHYHCL